MNKADIVSQVAGAGGWSKAEATKAVEHTLEAISAALKKNQEVRLVGFGTFTVSKRNASKGRNPRTGEQMKIPAFKLPRFRPGKALRDAVNAR